MNTQYQPIGDVVGGCPHHQGLMAEREPRCSRHFEPNADLSGCEGQEKTEMAKKNVMVIVPTRNGYALMPFDMNCMVSMENAQKNGPGVLVSNDLEGLKANVETVYGSVSDKEEIS